MPLQQVNFKTNIFAGTKEAEGTGTALARLVTAGMKTANTAVAITKQLNDQERKEQNERDSIAYLSEINRYNKEFNEQKKSGGLSTSDDMYGFNKSFLDKTEELFPDKDSEYRYKAQAYFMNKDNIGHTMLKQENMNAYNHMVDYELADIKASDLSLDELDGIVSSAKFLNPMSKKGDIIQKVIGHSTRIMDSELNNPKQVVAENEDVMDYDDIVEHFGGSFMKDVKNTKSKEYIAFHEKAEAMANGLAIAHRDREADRFVKQGGNGINGKAKFGDKVWEKTVKNNMNELINKGDYDGLTKVVKQHISTGGNIDMLNENVGGQFKSGVGSADSVKTFNMTKGTIPYSQAVKDDFLFLEVVAHRHGLDMSDDNDVSSAISIMNAGKVGKVQKGLLEEFEEEVSYDPWFGSAMSKSQMNFVSERGKQLLKLGMSPADALELSKEMLEESDILNNEMPIGMIIEDKDNMEEGAEILLMSFSPDNEIEDVDLSYIGNDTWLSVNEKTGYDKVFTSNELKKRLRRETKLNDTREVYEELVGETLRGEKYESKKYELVKKQAFMNATNLLKERHPNITKDELDRQVSLMFRDTLDKIKEIRPYNTRESYKKTRNRQRN